MAVLIDLYLSMKRHVLILILIAISGFVNAQDSSKVRYGFKLGVNEVYSERSSSFSEANPAKMESFTSFSGALVVDIPLYKRLSVQPSIEYGIKGQLRKLYNSPNKMEYRVKYWTLPVNFVYTYKNFYLGAGGYGAYATKGTFEQGSTKRSLEIGENYFSTESKNNDEWKVYDIGLNGIFGYKFWKLTLGIRYDLGLRDLDPNPYYSTKTRRAGIELGMLF